MHAADACSGDHCITCSDAAVSMTVLAMDAATGLACCVAQDGTAHIVEIGLIDDAMPGAAVLVHAGVAIASDWPSPLEGAR